MANLIVGAVTVLVAGPTNGPPEQYQEIGGERARMFDGTLRSTVIGRKRVWSVTTKLLSATSRAALLAALDGTPPIACSGDLLGGSVNCIAQRTGSAQQWAGGQIMYAVSFTLYEQ